MIANFDIAQTEGEVLVLGAPEAFKGALDRIPIIMSEQRCFFLKILASTIMLVQPPTIIDACSIKCR